MPADPNARPTGDAAKDATIRMVATLDDVAGCDEAKLELTEAIDFLRSPERFHLLGARIPRGIMLYGPPGTGKTMLARAVASEAGVPFHYASGSEFVEKYVGVGARRIRDLFAQARKLGRGVIFLDEVSELSLPAQAMLLRVLGEGEIVPVGSTQVKQIDVRVVAATTRDLVSMVQSGGFRADLYYRLCCLHVAVPPVRERGCDWELIASYYLDQLSRKRGTAKRLSVDARAVLGDYSWPGNVRELKSVVNTGFHLSNGELIEPPHFMEQLEAMARAQQLRRIPLDHDAAIGALHRMLEQGETFWDVVHRPYFAHEMSRADARLVVERGLERTRGSYKRLVQLFNMPPADYLKLMDFLRHQRLKPETAIRATEW